jgi:hypothetical protein
LPGNGNGNAALEDEEHDYEALPIGHGWATNMAAGALAGISEHAAIFPVDSIKVCLFACCRCVEEKGVVENAYRKGILGTGEGKRV